MAKADLTAQHLRELLDYNLETGIFVRRVTRSQNAIAGNVCGSRHNSGYVAIRINGVSYLAHRLAWLYVNSSWPIDMIDHINGDKADNRITNLRCVTNRMNTENIREPRGKTAVGLLGVTTDKRLKKPKYTAQITTYGERIYLGSFKTPEEAHDAYLRAKRKLHAGCTT